MDKNLQTSMSDLFWLYQCSAHNKLNQSYDVRKRPKNNINIFSSYVQFKYTRLASMTVYQVKSSYKVWFMRLEKDDEDLTYMYMVKSEFDEKWQTHTRKK